MNREEFLEKLSETILTEDVLSFDTELSSLEYWDSLAIMETIAFLDKEFNVKTVLNDYKEMKTVEDIAKKAGIKD